VVKTAEGGLRGKRTGGSKGGLYSVKIFGKGQGTKGGTCVREEMGRKISVRGYQQKNGSKSVKWFRLPLRG